VAPCKGNGRVASRQVAARFEPERIIRSRSYAYGQPHGDSDVDILVIMLARNTFNPSLVFFSIAVIGALGFAFDWLLRQAQRRILYWLPDQAEKLRVL